MTSYAKMAEFMTSHVADFLANFCIGNPTEFAREHPDVELDDSQLTAFLLPCPNIGFSPYRYIPPLS